jgi:predicted O-methyltransferase YrrM
MSSSEREILNSLILRYKPKKLLEIGVCSGGSSIVMLNAIKDIDDAKLYSIEYCTICPHNANERSGYFVNNYPELKKKWQLFTGGLALRFIDEIGADIDFCFIDTVHFNPGEILDFLMVLPYLKQDAVVVFHDTNLQAELNYPSYWSQAMTNNLLISAIFGTKLLQGNFVRAKRDSQIAGASTTYFPNIAGIKLNKQTKQHIFEVFNLLTQKWQYAPSQNEQKEIENHLERFYDKQYIDYLKDVFDYERQCLNFDLLQSQEKSQTKAWLKKIKQFFIKKPQA